MFTQDKQSDDTLRRRAEAVQKFPNMDRNVVQASVKKTYWPETTYKDYCKSFNRFKSTALIYSHNVNCILKSLKPFLFDDDKQMFMGEYNLTTDQYSRIKKWYNYCCDNLKSEMADFLYDMRADKRLEREDIVPRGLLNPGKAHMFEPSGMRRRRGGRRK